MGNDIFAFMTALTLENAQRDLGTYQCTNNEYKDTQND